MSMKSEIIDTKNAVNAIDNSTDEIDYIEKLKHTSKKWKMEFSKLSHELFDKKLNKIEVYDTDVEKYFDNRKETISEDKVPTYEKDFEEIEGLLKVIEGKQEHLKNLNESLLDTVTKNVAQIMKVVNLIVEDE